MSVSMYWFKAPDARRELGSTGYPLKGILAKRYGQYDGSCHEDFVLNKTDLEYIRGLSDAGIEDATKLLSDLENYGSVEVSYR